MAAKHVERIGARIRTRREELHLSRAKLVERMAGVVTENDLYRWERGQHRPHDDTLQELAKALTVDVSYFLSPEPEPGTPDLLGQLGDSDLSQLDRIESKLDAVLQMLSDQGVEDAGLAADEAAG